MTSNMGDLVWVLFLVVLIWMLINLDGGGPGGKRIRVRLPQNADPIMASAAHRMSEWLGS